MVTVDQCNLNFFICIFCVCVSQKYYCVNSYFCKQDSPFHSLNSVCHIHWIVLFRSRTVHILHIQCVCVSVSFLSVLISEHRCKEAERIEGLYILGLQAVFSCLEGGTLLKVVQRCCWVFSAVVWLRSTLCWSRNTKKNTHPDLGIWKTSHQYILDEPIQPFYCCELYFWICCITNSWIKSKKIPILN